MPIQYKLKSRRKTWDRHNSEIENLLFETLKDAKEPLTLEEMVGKIRDKDPSKLSGANPQKSLYSIIYRREKRRVERGHEPLLQEHRSKYEVKYSLNSGSANTVGVKITKP